MVGNIQGIGSNIQGVSSMPPMRGMGDFPPPQPLTEEQKTQVQNILSNYDPSNITAENAKAIFKAFRDAEIGGPELRDAVQSAGFDPEKLWSLVHPGEQAPAPGRAPGSENKIDFSLLQTLQTILSQFDLSNLTGTEEEDLVSKLNDAGLMRPGNMIDVSA
jgi:hypothetical protein